MKMSFEKFIGRSDAMLGVYDQIKKAAKTEVPILLIGETGTGKDLAAQAIHKRSARRDKSYIPVNLGALPSELVASELFGHEKGSFTGAIKQYIGKFEQGHGGTIFLDEIDSIDEKIQVTLLRLIEQKKFHRLGGNRSVSTDVRLIIATNADIDDLVSENAFREDLFYRLDVFRIILPPLRIRKEDIDLLTYFFIERFNMVYNKNITHISDNCLKILKNYKWPGNVRELKNVIQRATLLCEAEHLDTQHLPPRFKSKKRATVNDHISFRLGTPLETIEKRAILFALKNTQNNRTKAAKLLGISRRALYNRLYKHRIL